MTLAIGASPATAATRSVPSVYPTIQNAIDNSSNGDIVAVAPGTYTGSGNRDITFNGKAITVVGTGGASQTIIDCQGSPASTHRGFEFDTNETSSSVLKGVTIQNGYELASFGGGGIRILGASPVIQQCVIKSCTAYQGGGVYILNGSPTIYQCDFTGNQANTTTLQINNFGGGLFVGNSLLATSVVNIADCVFNSNSAQADGGAISTSGLLAGLSVFVTNCSFYGNNALGVGEVISLASQPGTISFNGLLNGATFIKNCILYGDLSGAELSTALPILNYTQVAYSDVDQSGPSAAQGNINSDPKYVAPASGNFHLGSGSPCIETGTPVGATSVDHDGNAWSGAVSMGAYDAALATHFLVSTASSTTAGNPLTVTVTALDGNNNVAYGYGGTVAITSSDGSATLPASAALTNGTGSFSVMLKTAGTQTVTATDTGNGSITGTSSGITVNPAAATRLSLTVPTTATAGGAISVTVIARDVYGNMATGYSGTVHFTSTDPKASLPANTTLTNGTGTFSATLNTAGTQTITATDTANASITGTSGSITVSPASAASFVVVAPASTTAGSPISVTVTARDAYGNTATDYSGTVHFTSTDPHASLPADTTLTGGTGTFSATLKTAANNKITATDTVTASISGTSGNIATRAGTATALSISAPSSASAGSSVSVTVTAWDAYGNTATGYRGTVHFTSTDPQTSLPANTTLTNGTGTFSATLKTAGTQIITATDTSNGSLTGTSGAISVSSATAAAFQLTIPGSSTAGSSFSGTIKVVDAFGNPATGYAGPVHFTSSDPQAVLPADTTLTNGVGTFTATLKTAGSQTITATDAASASITGTSVAVTVSPANVTASVSISAPSATVAGTPVSVTVTAYDQYGNVAAGNTDTFTFTTSDIHGLVASDTALPGGAGSFPATLYTSGTQTITVTDTVHSSIRATATITVAPGSVGGFRLFVRSTYGTGSPIPFSVQALDAFGNFTTYNGTVHFSCSDGAASLPADSALTNGAGSFSATLYSLGSQTLTVNAVANTSYTGTSIIKVVTPGPAVGYTISTPSSVAANAPFTFKVTAVDANTNIANGYTGTVYFTSSDPAAVLPANVTLTNGVGTFTATMKTAGARYIAAYDTANRNIHGQSANFSVTAH